MKARVKWAENRTFIGTSGTGHKFVFGTKEEDGSTPGPSPMELVLIGTGGCSAYDVVSILEKGREPVEDVVRSATESAVREIVGGNTMEFSITEGRAEIAARTESLIGSAFHPSTRICPRSSTIDARAWAMITPGLASKPPQFPE